MVYYVADYRLMAQPVIYACVGSTRINFGKWYSPIGYTSSEFTYCEWCVQNGCVNPANVRDVGTVNQCNCDCANRQLHVCIEKFVCDRCKSEVGMMTCDMSTCEKCNGPTTSGCIMYCNGCSALFRICIYCGVNK